MGAKAPNPDPPKGEKKPPAPVAPPRRYAKPAAYAEEPSAWLLRWQRGDITGAAVYLHKDQAHQDYDVMSTESWEMVEVVPLFEPRCCGHRHGFNHG